MTLASTAIVALLAQPPAAPSAQACATELTVVHPVRQVAEGIVAADNDRDLTRVLSHYATDAVLLPPDAPPVAGLPEIRKRYEALFAAFQPAIIGHVDVICVSGVLATVRGRSTGRLTPIRPTASPRILNDVYLMSLRRDASGTWRIAELMWHRAAAIVPGDAPNPGATDGSPGDERDIRFLAFQFQHAWAIKDALEVSSVWTPLGDMMHPDGTVERLRVNIYENRGRQFRDRRYRDSVHPTTVTQVKFLSADIAVADGKWEVSKLKDENGNDAPRVEGLFTWVVMRTGEGWRIASWRYTIGAPADGNAVR